MRAMTSTLPSFVQPLGHGIHAIDTGFHRDAFDAAYLLVHGGRAAFIDTGTAFAVPRLLAALQVLGLERSAVDWVIPTHVHLDHAGGVGTLLRELPAARVLVHPRGARHIVDPAALWQGALAVYGEAEMQRSYGQLHGVPAERVDSSADGMRVTLGGRELLLAETPGHAKHHHCIWDATSRGWFTGDTFGLSYREFDRPGENADTGAWVLPSSTPVQFDPVALEQSITRLLATEPQCMYLTHYSRVGNVHRLAGLLRTQLAQMVALGEALRQAPDRHVRLKAGLEAIYVDSVAAHGCQLDATTVRTLLAIDVELNAQGMGVWLDRG